MSFGSPPPSDLHPNDHPLGCHRWLYNNSLSRSLPTQLALLNPYNCYLTTALCHAVPVDPYSCTSSTSTNVFDCPLPSPSSKCAANLNCTSWPASCARATPQPPLGPTPPQGATRWPVYRVQAPTWVSNISNSDVADVAGASCVLERLVDPTLYGDHPVFARYILEAEFGPGPVGPGNKTYLNCPDDTLPRKCLPNGDNSSKYYVGMASCSPGGQPCDCSYISPSTFGDYGRWYSLPAGGECLSDCEPDPGTGSCVGYSCHWQVASIDKIVSMECMRAHGCKKLSDGGCPPATLEQAFDACPDLCTPPVESCSVPSNHVPSNDLHRLSFDPAHCVTCLQGGGPSGWRMNQTGSWSCGRASDPKARGTLSITGAAANATQLCRCAYGDGKPQALPVCPGGSYDHCMIKCLQQGNPEQKCHDSCTILCPHASPAAQLSK